MPLLPFSAKTTTAVTQSAGNNTTKIANTAFVTTAISNAIAGVNPAVAVQYATTAAADTSALTYSNGASGIGATLTGANNAVTAIDGHTFVVGDVGVTRVLVKNDTQSPSAAFNGVYLFTALHTAITGDTFTRALDYNSPSDINNTGAIPVVSGTVNALTSWLLTTSITTVGTDPLTYAQFSYNPTTIIPLSLGGTSANLTANNGGIFYSTASAGAILAGTATANKILYSGATAAPSWSTPTFPVTSSATSGKIIISDGTNWVASTSTIPTSAGATANKVLLSDGTNYVLSTPTFPNASATSGKFIRSDGTNWIASTPTLPTSAGSAGKILRSDGTNYVESTPTYPNAGTTGKVIIGDGTNYVESTPTFPNASATSGKFIRSDGTNWIASTPTLPTSAGTAGKILRSDGTNYIESTPTYPNAATTTGAYMRADGTNFIQSTLILPNAVTTGDVVIGSATNTYGVVAVQATANKVLMAGASAAPTWSTPTFPNASATSGKFIRSDGTNWIASTPTLPTSAGSAGKILASDGTNYVESTPTFPYSASATSGKVIKSDGTNWVASTETYAAPGTSGNVLTSNGTNWTSAAPAAATNVMTFQNAGDNGKKWQRITSGSQQTTTGFNSVAYGDVAISWTATFGGVPSIMFVGLSATAGLIWPGSVLSPTTTGVSLRCIGSSTNDTGTFEAWGIG